MSQINRLKRFGESADLVYLNQDGIADFHINAIFKALPVCNKQIVADKLNFTAEPLRQLLPAVLVIFAERVLD